MATIHTRIESARGCGYRKKGGKYLISDGAWASCGVFPIPLDVCPCCGEGIKFSRGFSWVQKEILGDLKCTTGQCKRCAPFFAEEVKKVGLMPVGGKFYPTPADFMKESNMAGLSKRIAMIPKDLKIGETWILLGHKKAITVLNDELGNILKEPKFKLGVFAAFIPTAIEYIVTGEESEEELNALEERGLTLVNVIPDTETQTDINQQLDDWEVGYYLDGDRNKHYETVQAHSETAARQKFKKMKGDVRTRIMDVNLMSVEK